MKLIRFTPLTTVAVAAIALAGCHSSASSAASSAASKAAPVVSSTFTQQELAGLESGLTTDFQAQLKAHPGHPITDAKAAIRQVFPQGDTSKILTYAVQNFTPAVATSKGPGSARDKWVKDVVTFAATSGGIQPSPTASSS